MLIDCSCGQTNRVPGASAKRHRCGKCQHIFTPAEMLKARHEPPPPKTTEEDLIAEMLAQFGRPTLSFDDD